MYKITGKNLEWAFRKLKTHYNYYHSSNFLKDKIIKFEKAIECGRTTFEKEANHLNEFVKDKNNRFSDYFNYGYKVYPKKNAFELKQNRIVINEKRVNYFVDTDLSIYLVDVLFALNLIEKIWQPEEKGWVYGGRIDKRIKRSTSTLKNPFLFEDYKFGYQKWCNIPAYISNDDKVSGDVSIIRTDISSCFYNAEFDFNSLLRRVGLGLDNVSFVMKNIYNLYTSIVKKAKDGKSKIFRKTILPIGFLSSQIIINYLFDEFDRLILANKNVIKNGYGRYVDDIIIAVHGNLENESFDTIFNDILGNAFIKRNDKISIRETNILPCELSINESKTFIKLLSKNIKPLKFDPMLYDVSFCDFTDSLRENSPAQFFKDFTNGDIRSYLYEVFNEPTDNLYNILTTISGDTILNCFSFWNDMFISFRGDESKRSNIFNQIDKAINRVEVDSESQIDTFIKNTLHCELSLAYDLAIKSPHEVCYLGEMSQKDIFDLIKDVDEKRYAFQPMIFSLVDLSLYLGFANIDNPSFRIQDATLEMYKRLNNIEDVEFFDTYCFDFDYSMDNIISIRDITSIIADKEKKTRIALGALNMKGLEKSDIVFKAPTGYNLDTILKLIRKAKAGGADYLLFPEFTLEAGWVLKVLKEARKNRISLISGIIHYKSAANVVFNLTLIFDSKLGIPLLKIKNYLSPEEKRIITGATQGMGCTFFEPPIPYYYVIDDGTICFSTMTCYEATNVLDRAILADKINVLFMPVYNYDTHYFSNIINSLSRDISCFVVQANSNQMGDSRIRMPVQDYLADKARIKGGLNNYIVVDEIDLTQLKEANKIFCDEQDDIAKGLLEPEFKEKEPEIKPLSAGNHHLK